MLRLAVFAPVLSRSTVVIAPDEEGTGMSRPTFEERLWSRITIADGCWEWTHSKQRGYGWIGKGNGRHVFAHRVVYELFRGPVPAGKQLDHLCRNRACVNPEHLDVVTARVNVLRGDGLPARNARKTHCKNGHALTGANVRTYGRRSGIERVCRTCARLYRNEYRRQKRASK